MVVAAVAVSVPPQVFEVIAGLVIRKPEAGVLGKMSTKLSPVKGTLALFVIVKTRATMLPFVVELGLNCFMNVGEGTEITERLTGVLCTAGVWLLVRVTAGLV